MHHDSYKGVGEYPAAFPFFCVQLRDAEGNIVASYKYDSWGKLTSTPTGVAALLNPYRYADYRYDDSTGLYYLIGRYYDPSIGRFISSDPTSVTPSYSYGGNNPLSYVDTTGYYLPAPDGVSTSPDHDLYDTDNSYRYAGNGTNNDSSDPSGYSSSSNSGDSGGSSGSNTSVPLMPTPTIGSVVPEVAAAGEGLAAGAALISTETVALATPAAPAAAIALIATIAVFETISLAKKNRL